MNGFKRAQQEYEEMLWRGPVDYEEEREERVERDEKLGEELFERARLYKHFSGDVI